MNKHNRKKQVEDQRYRVLIDHAPEPVLILDAELYRFVDANPMATKVLGYTKTELCQVGPVDISPPFQNGEPAAQWAEHYIKKALQGSNPTFEWVHFTKDGDEIFLEVRLIRFPPYDRPLIRCSLVDLTEKKAMQQALRESEERLQLALKSTGCGYYDWYPETGQLHWDAKMHELYELPPDSNVDRNEHFFSVLHEEDKSRTLHNFTNILSPDSIISSFEDEYRIVFGDEVRYIISQGMAFRDEKGQVLRIIGTNRDVTTERKREKLLHFTSERLEQAQKLARIGSFETDLVRRKTWWSEGLYRIHKVQPGSSVPSRAVFMEKVHPDDYQALNEQINNCIRFGGEQQLSYRLVLGGGRIKYMEDVFHGVKDKHGQVVRLIGSSQDVTDRKIAEQELKKTYTQLSLAVDVMELGIWYYQVETGETEWNDRLLNIYGLRRAEFQLNPETWIDFLHPEDRGETWERLSVLQKGQRLTNLEFRIIRSDGKVRYIQGSGSPIFDQYGKITEIIGVNVDITQEKEAEQQRVRAHQLELRNNELEQFAYVASHDLQEPLRTVTSFVGLLKDRYQGKLDPEADEYINFIVSAASRMSQLIKGLLEYARIGTDRELGQIETGTLINNVLQDLSAQITDSKATIELEGLPTITGYETELRILFQNLISNALKFRQPDVDPVITIKAKRKDFSTVFSITDNGIGIEPRYQEQIFVLFKRLHGQEKFKGTGIGLAHCQKIVDLHGGTIWVESEPGKGSTFHFSVLDQP